MDGLVLILMPEFLIPLCGLALWVLITGFRKLEGKPHEH